VKVLFIKIGALGDVIQAAAAVREFRSRYSVSRFDWVAGKQVSGLIRAFGVADEVLELDEISLMTGGVVSRYLSLLKFITYLSTRNRSYDKVVIAYQDWRYCLLTLGVRAKQRVRFDPRAARPSPIHQRNRVFEYWRLLQGNEEEIIDIAKAMQDIGDAVMQTADPEIALSLPKEFLVLAPGGAKNILRSDGLRRWSIEYYYNLTQRLLSDGHQIVLVGGPGDLWVSQFFTDLPIVDLIGKTTLVGLIHILNRAAVVVTHDSGPIHLAAITHTGLVALFGPTPPNAILPIAREKTTILHEGNRIACCPCYDGKNYAPCSKAACLESITVERVHDAVMDLLPR
jgi:heptosyltransferase II